MRSSEMSPLHQMQQGRVGFRILSGRNRPQHALFDPYRLARPLLEKNDARRQEERGPPRCRVLPRFSAPLSSVAAK